MKKQFGYTLVELMVVVAIFAVLLASASGLFFYFFKNYTKAKAIQQVKQNGDYALSVMSRMIRNARAIDGECSDSQTQVTIKNPDGFSTTFSFSGGRIASNSSYLTSSEVEIDTTNSYFKCVQASDSPPSIEIKFILGKNSPSSRPEEKVSLDFKTTVVLRNITP